MKTVPDLYHFVPYTWTINLQIKDFELVLLTNEYNWIDTSSHQPENGRLVKIKTLETNTLLKLFLICKFKKYPMLHVEVTKFYCKHNVKLSLSVESFN